MVIIPGIDIGALFEQQPRDLRGTSKMQWVPPVAAGRADECGLTPQHLAEMGLQTKTSGRMRRQFGTPSDEGRSYRRIYPTQTKAGPPPLADERGIGAKFDQYIHYRRASRRRQRRLR